MGWEASATGRWNTKWGKSIPIGGPTALRARVQAELGVAGPPVLARRTSGAAFSRACTGGTAQVGGSPLAALRAVYSVSLYREGGTAQAGGSSLAASQGGVQLRLCGGHGPC